MTRPEDAQRGATEWPFALRLALTLLLPAAHWVGSEHAFLPGSAEIAARALARHQNLSVFALGILPYFAAYQLVELAAYLVPSWQRLRHDNPRGRAQLERVTLWLSAAFALLQAFGIAMVIANLNAQEGTFPTPAEVQPSVILSLVAGYVVTLVMANVITRQGLVNGVFALFAAGYLKELFGELYSLRLDSLMRARALQASSAVLLIASFAVWFTLRRVYEPGPAGRAGTLTDAASLARQPSILPPLGSIQAYTFGAGLLALPKTLLLFHAPLERVLAALSNRLVYLLVLVHATLVIGWVLGLCLHRARELGHLRERLGVPSNRVSAVALGAAMRSAFPASAAFWIVLILCGEASRSAVFSVVPLVPILMDLWHGSQLALRAEPRVVVWEDRRVTALPVVQAVLASQGIQSDVAGVATLTLWQLFVPFAAATVLVRSADAERARGALAPLRVGSREPALRAASEPIPEAAKPDASRTVTGVLAACAVLALFALAHAESVPTPRAPRAALELVRVDDASDPFADVADDTLAACPGVSVMSESVSLGGGKRDRTRFARLALGEGESERAGADRFQQWLAAFALLPDQRLAVGSAYNADSLDSRSNPRYLRSYLVTGASAIHAGDVTDARASVAEDGVNAYVGITLSREAGARFEVMTRDWVQRRIAIVVDGKVVSAPVVSQPIGGGHVQITMGAGQLEEQLAQARALERQLMGG